MTLSGAKVSEKNYVISSITPSIWLRSLVYFIICHKNISISSQDAVKLAEIKTISRIYLNVLQRAFKRLHISYVFLNKNSIVLLFKFIFWNITTVYIMQRMFKVPIHTSSNVSLELSLFFIGSLFPKSGTQRTLICLIQLYFQFFIKI